MASSTKSKWPLLDSLWPPEKVVALPRAYAEPTTILPTQLPPEEAANKLSDYINKLFKVEDWRKKRIDKVTE